jgi:hypothetical protein
MPPSRLSSSSSPLPTSASLTSSTSTSSSTSTTSRAFCLLLSLLVAWLVVRAGRCVLVRLPASLLARSTNQVINQPTSANPPQIPISPPTPTTQVPYGREAVPRGLPLLHRGHRHVPAPGLRRLWPQEHVHPRGAHVPAHRLHRLLGQRAGQVRACGGVCVLYVGLERRMGRRDRRVAWRLRSNRPRYRPLDCLLGPGPAGRPTNERTNERLTCKPVHNSHTPTFTPTFTPTCTPRAGNSASWATR